MEQSQEKRQLAQLLRSQLANCVGYIGDELATSRKQAYDYYFQRPRGDEVQGRSSIVSGDLSSMVEGNLAQMVEPLLARRIGEFCAYSEQDEEQAQLESECVTEMLFRRQNGFIEVASAIKDALLVRNGIIKVYIDERTHTQRFMREGVAKEIVPDVLEKFGTVDVHSYEPDTGTLSATLTKTTRRFSVECLAPENFLFPKDWHRQDLEGIGFCAERHVEPRSTLLERGFKNALVEDLPAFNAMASVAEDARRPRQVSGIPSTPIDKSQQQVEWYETYARIDDGNGAGELRRICVSGHTILDDQPVDFVCYATGVAIVNPHTFIGISLHDKLKAVQDSSTALTRALMDGLNATMKNRTAHLDGVVEADDLQDGRFNSSIRVRPGNVQDVRQAITAFAVPDTSANILQNLEHQRRVRSEMGGATLDMATGQMQLNDRLGSQGLDRAYSVMEQLASYMTRTIAQTLIRALYLKAHHVLRTQWQQPISFRMGKQWVQQDPSQWQVRESVTINMGAPLNERLRVSQTLEKAMDKQAGLASMGMEDILVTVQNYYAAFVEWLRVNDLEVPERYVTDPRSQGAQDALKARAQQRQQASMKQDAMIQQALALEQLRTALGKYQTDAELQFKYYAEVLNAQIEEAKLAVQGVVDMLKVKQTAQTQADKPVKSQSKGNGSDTVSDKGSASESGVATEN